MTNFDDSEIQAFINSFIEQSNAAFALDKDKQLTPTQIGKLLGLHLEAIDHLISHPNIECPHTKAHLTAISFHLKSLGLFIADCVSERESCIKATKEYEEAKKNTEPNPIEKAFKFLGIGAKEDKKVH